MREKVMLFEFAGQGEDDHDDGEQSRAEVYSIIQSKRKEFEKTPVYARLSTCYDERHFNIEVQIVGIVDEDNFMVVGNPYYEYDPTVLEVISTFSFVDWLSPRYKEAFPPGEHPTLLSTDTGMDIFESLYFYKEDISNKGMAYCLQKEENL